MDIEYVVENKPDIVLVTSTMLLLGKIFDKEEKAEALVSLFIAKTVYPDLFADIDITEKTNEVTKVFLGAELAEEIFAYPSSFGGYQKIDTATFFG